MNSNYDRSRRYDDPQTVAAKARRRFLLNRNTRWHGQKDCRP